MELIALKIRPLSAFSTVPKGDTLFGHIVAYDFLTGGRIFENYLNEKPKLIVSDMMPLGYVYRPKLPLECFVKNIDKKDRKKWRKKEYIKIDDFLDGNFSMCEEVEFWSERQVIKNSINRVTFTTDSENFAPYENRETVFSRELWVLMLVEKEIKKRVLELIKMVGKFGFGKDTTTGKGYFEVKEIEARKIDLDSNYYMSISPVILEGEKFIQCWYEPFTRFGKFGLDKAHGNAFKKPVLMANSGAVVKSDKKIKFFGKAKNNGNDKPSFLQGYSIALPFKIKDEKCLNAR